MTIDFKSRRTVEVLITLSFFDVEKRQQKMLPPVVQDESRMLVVVLAVCVAAYFLWRRSAYLLTRSTVIPRPITRQQAVEIYERKLAFTATISNEPKRSKNAKIRNEYAVLGDRYNISARAVSDIWNRKTWVVATSYLWSLE